jgi:hypothetical protein
MDRPVPNPWRSWRRKQRKIADLDGVLDPVSFVDFGESIAVTIAVVVVAVLIELFRRCGEVTVPNAAEATTRRVSARANSWSGIAPLSGGRPDG